MDLRKSNCKDQASPRRRIGSLSASTQSSSSLASRLSPPRSTYTQVRSRTAVMRTVAPASVASNPSISTSSSSSSTSLRRRDPPGRTLVESCSCGRGPWGGLGLMVSLDEGDPANRVPGRDVGDAGREGRGLGGGSGIAGRGPAVASGVALGAAFCGAGWRALGGAFFAARARGAWPRGPDDFLDDRLEELTPEFPDPADRVRHCFQSYDGRLRRDLRHLVGRRVRDALGMDADDAVVDTAFLHDERAHCRVSLQPPAARDLEPAARDHVAPYQPGDRDADAADVRFDMPVGPHQQVSIAVYLPGE